MLPTDYPGDADDAHQAGDLVAAEVPAGPAHQVPQLAHP
jgi:hypothetical protein